jgi:Domain of unknown function (DUF4440)
MTAAADLQDVEACARKVATAIGARDLPALRALLSPDFVHRTLGGGSVPLEPFLAGIEQMPWEILSVTLEQVVIDLADGAALVTGRQHAQVRVNDALVDDRRPFADWFVKVDGGWRLRAAIEPPHDDA